MEELKITKEEYEELREQVIALRVKIQDLEDIIVNDISNINMSDDAVTGRTIINDAITADHIKTGAIDASKIAVGTITSDRIEEGTIAADRLKVGDITALQISTGSITAGLLKTGGQAFSHNLEFSSTDADTVTWTAGTLKTADGTSYSIDAGNTGNMTARTYIYLDKSVSETELQVSTSYDAPLGDNRIPIATAEDGTGNAIFQVFAGGGGVFISGGMIAAHTIGATQINAGAVTANEITVTSLQSLSQNCGTLTAGSISGVIITGSVFNVGSTSQGYVNFARSGIKLYDASSNELLFHKTNYAKLEIWLQSSARANIATDGQLGLKASDEIILIAGTKYFYCYDTGTFKLPALTSAPTSHAGDLAFNTSSNWISSYTNQWEHMQTSTGW